MSSFKHSRDARDIRTRVVVKGQGTEAGALIYAIYTDHLDDYPTKYQRDPGWSGEPYSDSRIDTLAKADTVATTIGVRVWGPKGTMTWRTARAGLEEGDVITITDPMEGQDHTRKIIRDLTEVAGSMGRRLWEIQVGDLPVDIGDLITRASTTRVLSDPGRGSGGGSGDLTGAALASTGMVGTPKQVPVEKVPTHSQRNEMQPRWSSVTAQRWKVQPTAAPTGLLAVDPLPVAPLLETWDADGVQRDWHSGEDGTGHPQHYVGHITEPSYTLIPIPDPGVLRAYNQQNHDTTANTDVTVTFKLNGSTVSPPSVGSPLTVARDDVLYVEWAGTFPTLGIAITISERYPT